MRRRRFLFALVIIASTLTLNVYVDYMLILRNPAELEVMVNEALKAIAPDYAPKLGSVLEFSLSERRVVFADLAFHEKGKPESPLLKVARVEATLSLVPPALTQITLIEPEAVVRVDEQGRLVPEIQGGGGGAPSLFSDLNVRIRSGRLRLINDYEGLGSEALVSDINVSLDVQTDLSVSGQGIARLGALFERGDPRGAGGTQPPGTPPDRWFKDVFPVVSFEVDGPSDGPLRAEVRLLRGSFQPALRSLIPLEFQQAIWEELQPSDGTVEARLSVLAHDNGTQLNVAVRPRGVTLITRGFPLPIQEVGGAFQVSLALADDRAIPEILNVAWEHVEGRVSGGRVVSRGSVWPSDPHEGTTLYVFIDAMDLALSPALVEAIPEGIREVYKTFDPQGVVRSARISLVGGPHDEEPQLFVEVAELDGSISAMHVDYRLRLEDIHGSFSLKPGPSVRVVAAGALEHGGTGAVDAQVLAGDLIHVEIEGQDVPLGRRVLEALPPSVRARVEPFRPQGGLADFRVVVEKAAEGEIVRPHVEVQVQGVGIRHDDFPYPLTATGSLILDPVFAVGATEADDPEPKSVALRLDLECVGPGLERGTVVGPLEIRLADGHLDGDLSVGVRGLQLDEQLLDVLPEELATIRQTLQPSGRVAQASARVVSPEQFQVQGRGEGLIVRLEAFDYPLEVETFQLERDLDEIRVRRARGTLPKGGVFAARGVVSLPREPGELPLVDVEAQAREVFADEQLMRAVPHDGVREFLLSMRPKGRLSADVRACMTPGIGNQPEILLDLQGVDLYLDQIVPELERFRSEPLRDVRGRVRVEVPGRVEVQGLRGTLAGSQVELAGVVGDPATVPSAACLSANGGCLGAVGAWARERLGVPLDLNLHVAGFDLSDETEDLLGPKARGILEVFPSRGRVDLAGAVHRGELDAEPHLLLRFMPDGLWVLPTFLQVPLEQVRGVLEIADGDPRHIDLSGQVGAGRFRLRREQTQEGRFFQGDRAGMALRVDMWNLGRPAEPAALEAFQRHLPAGVRSSLDDANPQGPLDVQLALHLPPDFAEGDGPIDWVAEIRPKRFAASAGLRLEDMEGVVRASGRFSEMRKGSAQGELRIERVDWKKQTLSDVSGPFRLTDGVLRLGARTDPLKGKLYGGRAAVLAEYRFSDGAYRGWLEVREGSIARCLEELGQLRDEPSEPSNSTSASRPLTGKIYAVMDFLGGGRRLDGRPRPFEAEGSLHVRETNLVEVKAFDWLRTVRDALRGESSKPEAFETMHVDYGMSLDRVTLRAVRLDSPSLILVGGEDLIQGGEGWIRLSEDPETNGDIFLDLTPFDTGSTVLDNLLQMSVPLTGVTVREKVYDPQVIVGVPFYGAAEKIWRGILGDEDAAPPRAPPRDDDSEED